MGSLLIRFFVLATAVALTTELLPGIRVNGLHGVVVTSLVLGILNVLVKPLLILFTLPLNLLSLGLFTFVINALVLLLADWLVDSLWISSFGTALLAGLLISLVQWGLYKILNEEKRRSL